MTLVPASSRGADPSANVDSVFGRTGVVVAAVNDYTDAQVQGSPTNILSGVGDMLYSSAANTLARRAVGTAGQKLVPIGGLPAWRTAATLVAQPSNPVGTTSASFVMCGLDQVITPATTGNVLISITGIVTNSGLNGSYIAFATGVGAPPANGVAATGTQRTATQLVTFGVASENVPFNLSAVVTGLALGTAVWIDLLQAATAGTASITSLTVSAVEV